MRFAGLAVLLTLLAASSAFVFLLRGEATTQPAGQASLSALHERSTSALVVYSELGEEADTLWAANPDDPSDRTQLGRAEHARGYGISPALSPDGGRVAYTVLPAGASLPELWLLDIDSGDTRRLLAGVDLASTPLWSPDSTAVVVRRSAQVSGDAVHVELLRVTLDGDPTTIAAHDRALYVIDAPPDGAIYYVSLSPAGSDLWRAPASGGAQQVAHLSDGLSRDWDLSPDGAQLTYLAQTDGGETTFAAHVLDLASGATQPVSSAGGPQFSPVWEPNGGITIGRLGAGGGAPLRIDVAGGQPVEPAYPLPAAPAGFDVPIGWSPDGDHLAARHFQGATAADPGPSRVEVLGTDGARRALSAISDVVIAGWWPGAP